ncbi:hypothetical protein BaRGS_00015573 [Batillaria attramentaria]|uniref:Uncharacterized protein n=1 Tax=Batillaria attramentaria TaxID=370345 RepID=A0ABD0L1W4_9CAEN
MAVLINTQVPVEMFCAVAAKSGRLKGKRVTQCHGRVDTTGCATTFIDSILQRHVDVGEHCNIFRPWIYCCALHKVKVAHETTAYPSTRSLPREVAVMQKQRSAAVAHRHKMAFSFTERRYNCTVETQHKIFNY